METKNRPEIKGKIRFWLSPTRGNTMKVDVSLPISDAPPTKIEPPFHVEDEKLGGTATYIIKAVGEISGVAWMKIHRYRLIVGLGYFADPHEVSKEILEILRNSIFGGCSVDQIDQTGPI